MERLNWHMAAELSRHTQVRVIGPAGSAAIAPAGVEVCEIPLQPIWKFLLAARAAARREARSWRPDLVLAGSGLTAPIARSAAAQVGARTAVYVHGLDVAVRHPAYRAFWLPAIRRMHRVIANSTATAQLCRGIGVAEDRIGVVHPGVELPAPIHPMAAIAATEHFREMHGLHGRALLLSVGRLSTRKGLLEFVSEALPCIVAERPDAMLLIVGDSPTQALHAQAQTPASIQAAADAAGVGQHLRFLGVVSDYAELGVIYRAADVHVFPVRSIPGDPEGFGMVAVEAAAHGLPTVAFTTGGVVDAVADGQSGRLVPATDYAAMAGAVCRVLSERRALQTDCLRFAGGFAWPEFGKAITLKLGAIGAGVAQGDTAA